MLGNKVPKQGSQVALSRAILPHGSPGVVLTIAGFDPSSGAGVTADLQTFAAHGLFGTAAITAYTVQSTLGVFETQPIDAGLLRRTLDRLQEDLPPRGIKVGMLASVDVLAAVAGFLRSLGSNRPLVVVDPVLRSSSGRELFPAEGLRNLHGELLPLADWLTPNWSELALLADCAVDDLGSAEYALQALGERHPHLTLVATGGEKEHPTDLLRLPSGHIERLEGTHVSTRSTHGTGCAFSAALLAHLLLDATPSEAAAGAKRFVEGALRDAQAVGGGRGPMELLWPLKMRESAG